MTLCDKCSHPLNSHGDTGRCNVAGAHREYGLEPFDDLDDPILQTGDGFVCDCGQPVIEEGEEVLGYIGFSSFRDDVA